MNWSENIRCCREKISMYQSDLGKSLGVSAQAVSKWELGKAEPDIGCILKMCDLFGITADQLLGREELNVPAPPALDNEIVNKIMRLPSDQVQRVMDFLQGMLAASKE